VTIPDALGLGGSVTIAFCYIANLRGAMQSDRWPYALLNLLGATLILVSLHWSWNLPAAIMEGFWALVSAYGLARILINYHRPL
jgi:hypothetical protein